MCDVRVVCEAHVLHVVCDVRVLRLSCRSLSCQRITLHKNLFVSFVLNSVITVVWLTTVVKKQEHSSDDSVSPPPLHRSPLAVSVVLTGSVSPCRPAVSCSCSYTSTC